MEHYKSWPALKRQLEELVCDGLRGWITYFLTHYHQVHNAYGRAAILLDGRELVCFSWAENCRQEQELSRRSREHPEWSYGELLADRNPVWEEKGTLSEMDFLAAALAFRNMPVQEALESENGIVRIFAILDRRTGRRTLEKIAASKAYQTAPEWLGQFYRLRLGLEA